VTQRQRVERTYAFEPVDRFPFVPAVYEHKGRLVGASPSAICRDANLLAEGLLAELETYHPDMLVAGVDVYNVEAEALGCEVRYFGDGPEVPAVVSASVERPDELKKLGLPDPEADGRMPLFLEAASRVSREAGKDLIVRGALSGPFSMASALVGTAELLTATLDEPVFVRALLEFAGRVTAEFGAAFLRRGLGIIVFDSKVSPAASSPRIFREFVLPVYRDIVFPELRRAGAVHLPLIIGGDTTPILGDICETGATQILCDAGSDLERFKAVCRERRIAFRANVDARLVHTGSPAEIRAEAVRILREVEGERGFLFGCGVVAYDCEPSHVLALRDALLEVPES
jgi:uroporphyrinogen decarboxylase